MSSHAKTKKKKKFRVMSQKVKVFRSKNPLLSVLMWGVSHSVSMILRLLLTKHFDWSLKLVLWFFSVDQRTLSCEQPGHVDAWWLQSIHKTSRGQSPLQQVSVLKALLCVYFWVLLYFSTIICGASAVYLLRHCLGLILEFPFRFHDCLRSKLWFENRIKCELKRDM